MILHQNDTTLSRPLSASPGPLAPVRTPQGFPRLDVARLIDNELVLFDRPGRESWIVYPPRSAYEHLSRPSRDTVLVEHHPWAPFSEIVLHAVRADVGCAEHGLECGANAAIRAGVEVGWNPFA